MKKLTMIPVVISMFIFVLNAESIIEISQGKLVGTTMLSRNGRIFSAYLGLPYAQTPVGNLRFKRPLPAANWQGVKKATTHQNFCPQLFLNIIIGSEDCLYLNVYSPLRTKNNTLLPVMVWIHGGGFFSGTGSLFGANNFLDKDIILVTFNYRLGILGFFTTGDLSAPGNFGLKDQVLALKWVKRNIKAFGGDPNRVTIFGESAGGASVSLHALSEASNGLFQQYIIQSGSSLSPWCLQSSSKFREPVMKIAKMVQCSFNNSKTFVNCLRSKSVETLLHTNGAFDSKLDFHPVKWLPVEEPKNKDAFLIDSPKNLIANNKMKDLPFISGIVADEGLLFTDASYKDENVYNFVKADIRNILSYTADHFLDLKNTNKFVDDVKKFYFNNSFTIPEKSEFLKSLTDTFSDAAFLYPELRLVQKTTPRMRNSNYLYSFGLANSSPNTGVGHGGELPFLFPLLVNVNLNVSQILVDLWTSFAINGKPTSSKLTPPDLWKPYDVQKNTHLQIGNIDNNTDPKITLSNSFYTKRMNFWKTMYPI
ncbi:venom carboxylesterase-6-like isoform X1 [Leptopilina heterotoma]|uniref:venom carboxylesterase-6-like isoform X1 n=1 Tax=Leptopilina heterotoma TaxID=63436 RepID=UPI001CA9D2E0|nr:venom carboxylesterase-6-like isoform X1 [Leptopilina heterotoma]